MEIVRYDLRVLVTLVSLQQALKTIDQSSFDDLSMTKCQRSFDSKQHIKLRKCYLVKTTALFIADINSL